MKIWIAGVLALCTMAVEPQARPQSANSGGDQASVSRFQQPQLTRVSSRRRSNAGGSNPQYDFLLLNLSWSPEFCSTHQASECGLHRAFIVHGLWPQRNDGTYPEHCGTRPGPTNPASWADVMPDVGLVKHEWQTHGTCTPYDADTYFGMIRKAFKVVKVPAVYSDGTKEVQMKPADILADFAKVNPGFPAGSMALSCGNNRLTAFELCMSKDLKPIACSAVKTCRANVVKITPVK
ncbi:ribonuclease T2 [soil metagenome]